MPTVDPEALDAAKARSTAQVLFKAARLVNDLALARIRSATGQQLRPSHTALFPHIDLEGTRLTEIARRVGVSKQAVAQRVSELVEMGTLERVPDPTDGRARLVRFAIQDGEHSILAGLRMLGALEAELAHEVGPARWAELHDTLTDLLTAVEERLAGLDD